MTDVVVTVPKGQWQHWLGEGDKARSLPTGQRYYFGPLAAKPDILRDERVYIVAYGRLRGWAPLVALDGVRHGDVYGPPWYLVRMGGARACTLPCWQGIKDLPLSQVEDMGAIEGYVRGTQVYGRPNSDPSELWCQPPHLCRRYPSQYGHIRGFQGYRYRWWPREIEIPYPTWEQP